MTLLNVHDATNLKPCCMHIGVTSGKIEGGGSNVGRVDRKAWGAWDSN